MTFCPDRLRGFREWRNWSRAALAARVHRSVEAVQSWETGRATPSPQSLAALASALYIEPSDLDRVHDDRTEDYVSAVLQDAPPMPDDAIEAVARVLRRTGHGRRTTKGGTAA